MKKNEIKSILDSKKIKAKIWFNLLQEFRKWDNEWEKYKGKGLKPKTINEFIDEINEKYKNVF